MALTVTDPIDAALVKADFPLLARTVHGKPIVYLDSAATSQKPAVVLDAMQRYYETINANVHRGVYAIAEEATNQMELARGTVRRFVNARSDTEIVFTKNATEALNLVVQAWGRANLSEGDVVVLTHMEHHANIVPWQILQREKGSRSAGSPSTTRAASTSPTSIASSTGPRPSASPPCRTCSARSPRCVA
jgi:cysteine desulfurase/selenocysteine lyase